MKPAAPVLHPHATASRLFADELSASSLLALAKGEILGIWQPGYLDASRYAGAVRAVEAAFLGRGRHGDPEPMSFAEVVGDVLGSAAGRERYLANALSQTREQRKRFFAPLVPPIDRLRLDLDELWLPGASAGRLGGRLMVPGTLRFYWPDDRMSPHVDGVAPPLGGLCAWRRLAANVYLQIAGDGGALELWTRDLSAADLERCRLPDWGLDREKIGPADCVIDPAAGDLVIFDSGRVHAVTKITSGWRITASCFIGVRSLDFPLAVFA